LKIENDIKTFVVTGPESTGKTALSKLIAKNYKAKYYSEYARYYINKLTGPYEYNDLVRIAEYQIEKFFDYNNLKNYKLRVFDTGLIITKVWFESVYHDVPYFLLQALETIKIDLYILCYPDIPWIPDKVRENGGIKRFELYERYKIEIEKYKAEYIVINGMGEQRFFQAKQYIDSAHCL
jgi:nicotinamide riboside kinase